MKRIAFVPGAAACCATLLAAALPLSAAAGPTIQVGEQGSLTLTYALQGWMQHRSFSAENHSGSSTDAFLRRNRLTFSGQYNDYVGFYAQFEAGNDS
ncbi:MAG: hypothetical protein KJ011_12440, partial [Burkholderiaceae bacterium]|nr:hypothetical protein [Burkholderiaceae bacterium]